MHSTFFSLELNQGLKEHDSFNRTMTLTNTLREITDVIPFKKRSSVILRDRRLMRYICLCLPFLENIVESVVNSMLYKFQDNLEFLVTFCEEIGEILKLKDGSNYYEDVHELWTSQFYTKQVHATNDFEETVIKLMAPEIRINLTRIKVRAFEYFQKAIQVLKVNFEEYVTNKCPELDPPVDPFQILNFMWFNTESPQLKDFCENLVFSLVEDQFYGQGTFRSQKTICDEIRPPNEEETKHNFYQVEDQSEDSLDVRGDGGSDADNNDSQSDTNTETDSDLDLDQDEDATVTDKIAIIQEWLFTDHLPIFSKNEAVIEYISDTEDLKFFFRFILSPFKAMMHHLGRKKYQKYTQKLKINCKKTLMDPNFNYMYLPKRHNIYYYRSQKMILCFLYKTNMKILKSCNPDYLNIFYKVLKEDFLDNPRSKADMTHVIKMIQYFYIFEPQASMINLLKTHFIYHLLGNLTLEVAKDTLTTFLCPGEMLLKVKEEERFLLYKYLTLTNFSDLFITQIQLLSVETIDAHLLKIQEDPEVLEFLSDMPDHLATNLKSKNMLLNLFHSLFNISLLNKHIKYPEDIHNGIQDIDRLGSLIMPNKRLHKKKAYGSIRRDSKGVSMSRISSSQQLDDMSKTGSHNEAESQIMEYLANQVDAEGARSPEKVKASIFNKTEYNKQSKKRGRKGLKMGKALKIFQRHVLALMTSRLILNRKGYMKQQRTMKLVIEPYVDKMSTPITHPEVRKIRKNKQQYYQVCLAREKGCCSVMQMLYVVLTTYHENRVKEEMAKKMKIFYGEGRGFLDIFFKDDALIFNVFWMFLIKIEYVLSNFLLFQSGYWAGKTFIHIAKNIDFYLVKKEDRTELARKLREYVSDACKILNLCQLSYRSSEVDIVKISPNLEVPPIGDIRTLIVEFLFSLILIDKETGYESVNKLHDSTFHILMIWAMEKCHNNIYLVKLRQMLDIYFKYASNLTLLNSIIKTNLFSDISEFFKSHVLGWNYINKIQDEYLWFFKDFINLVKSVRKRTNCDGFITELDRSLNWKYIDAIYKNGFKVDFANLRKSKRRVRRKPTKAPNALRRQGTTNRSSRVGFQSQASLIDVEQSSQSNAAGPAQGSQGNRTGRTTGRTTGRSRRQQEAGPLNRSSTIVSQPGQQPQIRVSSPRAAARGSRAFIAQPTQ